MKSDYFRIFRENLEESDYVLWEVSDMYSKCHENDIF